jgi:hypothetical protein
LPVHGRRTVAEPISHACAAFCDVFGTFEVPKGGKDRRPAEIPDIVRSATRERILG